MRRALVLLSLLLAPLGALAEDGSKRLPFTPWSNAKVGDYSVTLVDSKTVTARVVAVASGSVTLERGGKTEVVSTAQAPTVAGFFGRWHEAHLTAWRVREDVLELDGLRVACSRLTFSVHAKGEAASVAVWFSPDVKGSGIVLVRVRHFEPAVAVAEEPLLEFGTSAGRSWRR